MKLVIVESPTKAKTITRFLGKEYRVESSFGHVRDLPKSKIGVDVEHNFEPQYVIPTKAKKRVSELKKLAAKADEIFLATDEDREGEAIAWHLLHILDTKNKPVQRITFHEITKEAIMHALETPRPLDEHIVDAQQGRRVLDRLVGYELSPFLWKKVYRGLSAGRVQSVVVRFIVEREREIQAFKPDEYWTIDGVFSKDAQEFQAALSKIADTSVKKLDITHKVDAYKIADALANATYTVESIEQKERQRKANPPFTTSTLQQEANNKLGYSAKQTMMIAQQLYEGIDLPQGSTGLITYMRTDSFNLADKFLHEAEVLITEQFGAEYAERKVYKSKSKGAQEAHEAIRPSEVSITPESIKQHLDSKQYKVYQLIWARATASQMAAARMQATTVDVRANEYTFRATGSRVEFDGWLKIYPDSIKENFLPKLAQGDPVDCVSITPTQHFTEPPARYTEAAIVKALEERGIGRPSTYAPTIATVQARGYVRKEERKLIPEEIGFMVNDLLVAHFPEIVDYDFTANMENELDEIADGKKEWQPVMKAFYSPFKQHLVEKDKELSKKDFTETESDEKCPKCEKPMIVKFGRFGKFLACTGYPECKTTQPLGDDGKPVQEEPTDKVCDKCGKPMVKKMGRFGAFFGCSGYPDCKNIVNIEKTIGVKCPKCGAGEIIEKRSRYGKIFYACNQYPTCQNAYWSKPNGEICPECSSLLVFGAKNTARCSSKTCKFKKELAPVAEIPQ